MLPGVRRVTARGAGMVWVRVTRSFEEVLEGAGRGLVVLTGF